MSKNLHTTLLALSGVLAMLFIGNLLIHLAFYLYDGNLVKFLSPPWMVMNAITVVLTAVFVGVMRKEGKVRDV